MDRKELLRVLEIALEEVRAVDPEMQAQQLHCFVEVAKQPGVSYEEVMKKTGIATGSISRNMAALSDLSNAYKGQPGKGLIRIREAADDRRKKVGEVAPRGNLLLDTMLDRVNNYLNRKAS